MKKINFNFKTLLKWPYIFIVLITVAGLTTLILYLTLGTKSTNPDPINITKNLDNPKIELNLFASNFRSITDIASSNNQADKRIFVLEKAGHIRIVNSDGQVQSEPFLDISSKTLDDGEMGLLGIVFHPDYMLNGYFYINYINKDQETIISRYNVSSDVNTADSTSEKILFRIQQPYVNHNGGGLKFGPDGFMYIALGDGGGAGDPENKAQDRNTLLGKILRIDVNDEGAYSIPPTNPFVNQLGVQPEIWAYGLRNPWRISFDYETGDLYIADVGQGLIEEVNFESADSNGGVNYGWRCYEGNNIYNTDGCLSADNYQQPIFEYNHDEGRCSITGGYVYRGVKYSALVGKYFYGDFCGGQLYYAENVNGSWVQTIALDTTYAISTFGVDNDNELYVADFNGGNIYKIVDTVN